MTKSSPNLPKNLAVEVTSRESPWSEHPAPSSVNIGKDGTTAWPLPDPYCQTCIARPVFKDFRTIGVDPFAAILAQPLARWNRSTVRRKGMSGQVSLGQHGATPGMGSGRSDQESSGSVNSISER